MKHVGDVAGFKAWATVNTKADKDTAEAVFRAMISGQKISFNNSLKEYIFNNLLSALGNNVLTTFQ